MITIYIDAIPGKKFKKCRHIFFFFELIKVSMKNGVLYQSGFSFCRFTWTSRRPGLENFYFCLPKQKSTVLKRVLSVKKFHVFKM